MVSKTFILAVFLATGKKLYQSHLTRLFSPQEPPQVPQPDKPKKFMS
jgi:hypothetical protein